MKIALCLHGLFNSQQDEYSDGFNGYIYIKNNILNLNLMLEHGEMVVGVETLERVDSITHLKNSIQKNTFELKFYTYLRLH